MTHRRQQIREAIMGMLAAVSVTSTRSRVIAVLPAIAAGALLHDWIKSILFSPVVVCLSLVVGGFVMLLVDRGDREVRFASVEAMPTRTARFSSPYPPRQAP